MNTQLSFFDRETETDGQKYIHAFAQAGDWLGAQKHFCEQLGEMLARNPDVNSRPVQDMKDFGIRVLGPARAGPIINEFFRMVVAETKVEVARRRELQAV
jgi:hypothetical protein